MQAPETPIDEKFRQLALESLGIVDTPVEKTFDNLVTMVRSQFDVPICLVSLVDNDRQWFKAKVGLDASETGRDISFCGHAILGSDVFVILNALDDERFFDNPLVTGPPNIRFYAGAPIALPNGFNIGTLCLMSPETRETFSPDARQALADSTALVVDILAGRALKRELDAAQTLINRQSVLIEQADRPMALLDSAGMIEECNTAFMDVFDGLAFHGESIQDFLDEPTLARFFEQYDDMFRVSARSGDVEFDCEREPNGFSLVARPRSAG
jgi:GAF domain-containing protein